MKNKTPGISQRRDFVRGIIAAAATGPLALAGRTSAQSDRPNVKKKAAPKKKAVPQKRPSPRGKPKRVTAANLGAVSYVDPAANQPVAIRLTEGRWIENSPNGPFTFVEVKRDQTSIYLYDEDRGMAMTLDLNGNQIIYGSANDGKLLGQRFGSYPIATRSAQP